MTPETEKQLAEAAEKALDDLLSFSSTDEASEMDEAASKAHAVKMFAACFSPLLAAKDAEIERLNRMIRETGQGQGAIDAYVAQCEDIDALRSQLAAATEHTKTQAEREGRMREAIHRVYWNHRLNKLWHHDNCNVRTFITDDEPEHRCECGFAQFSALSPAPATAEADEPEPSDLLQDAFTFPDGSPNVEAYQEYRIRVGRIDPSPPTVSVEEVRGMLAAAANQQVHTNWAADLSRLARAYLDLLDVREERDAAISTMEEAVRQVQELSDRVNGETESFLRVRFGATLKMAKALAAKGAKHG